MNNQSESSQFSESYKETSYWLDDISSSDSKNEQWPELPEQTDLVIIGSGYTGLNAAIETAAQGVETLVIDQGDLGQGCSTKNGGQISTSIKPTLKALSKKYGGEKANAIRQEGLNALNWIEDFITLENLNCEFTRCGRFHGAHTPSQYEQMCSTIRELNEENIIAHPVEKFSMSSELGTDFYHGGLVFPDNASLHPAKYHRELLRSAEARGSKCIGNCKALKISRDRGRFVISTSKGEVVTKKLAIATNGYTSSLTPWLKRRIIPIGS